jgi:hypothetical protein
MSPKKRFQWCNYRSGAKNDISQQSASAEGEKILPLQ